MTPSTFTSCIAALDQDIAFVSHLDAVYHHRNALSIFLLLLSTTFNVRGENSLSSFTLLLKLCRPSRRPFHIAAYIFNNISDHKQRLVLTLRQRRAY